MLPPLPRRLPHPDEPGIGYSPDESAYPETEVFLEDLPAACAAVAATGGGSGGGAGGGAAAAAPSQSAVRVGAAPAASDGDDVMASDGTCGCGVVEARC
jgi:hypothetical protein